MNLKEFTEKYGNKEVEEEKLKELLGIKESKVWKPRYYESYWCVGAFGGITQSYWENMIVDKHRYSIGNCYKTEEEVTFAFEKQIFMTKLERDFIENSDEIDWEDLEQLKYNIRLCNGDLSTNYQSVVSFSVPVTTNEAWLKNYIKENEADIKKYLFGIGV